MKKYIGVKMIEAEPMSKNMFNCVKNPGVAYIPEGDVEGYNVFYPDGYVSWSPKAVFEEAYRECDCMTFGLAIEAMKKGCRVARKGWNGKNMWLSLVPGSRITVSEGRPLASSFPVGSIVEYLPHIDMKTADDKVVPWLASQTDMLSEDWVIVE